MQQAPETGKQLARVYRDLAKKMTTHDAVVESVNPLVLITSTGTRVEGAIAVGSALSPNLPVVLMIGGGRALAFRYVQDGDPEPGELSPEVEGKLSALEMGVERVEATAAQLNANFEGTGLRPAKVTGLAATAEVHIDDQGGVQGSIVASWDVVESASEEDGGGSLEILGYEVATRKMLPADPWIVQQIATENKADVFPVPTGIQLNVRVRALSNTRTPGEWSDFVTVMVVTDDTPPPVSAPPTLTTNAGIVYVHIGGGFVGGAAKPKDFSHFEVWTALDGAPATYRGQLPGAGTLAVPSASGQSVVAHLISVDTSGNKAAPSTTATITALGILDDPEVIDRFQEAHDLFAQAQTDIDAVQGNLTATEADLNQQLEATRTATTQAQADAAAAGTVAGTAQAAADDALAAAIAASNAIGNLQIGGRNFLKYTSSAPTNLQLLSSQWYAQFGSDYKLVAGDTYTFSLIVDKISQDAVPINLSVGTGTQGAYTYDIPNGGINNIPFGVRVSKTFTVTPADVASPHLYFAWRLRNEQQATTVAYREVKLEKGNQASDWTPALEDAPKVIIQSNQPGPEYEIMGKVLWIDTTGGANTPKRYSVNGWVAITDKVAQDAANAAVAAQQAADAAGVVAAAAKALADEHETELLGVQSNIDSLTGRATTVEGKITIATANPTPANAVGKPENAIWEVRAGVVVLSRWLLTGGVWQQVTIGQNFIGENAIGSAQIINLSVGEAEIADLAVTNAKVGTISASKLRVLDEAEIDVGVINLLTSNTAFITNLRSQRVLIGSMDNILEITDTGLPVGGVKSYLTDATITGHPSSYTQAFNTTIASGSYQTPTFQVEPGGVYRMEFWVKGNSTSPRYVAATVQSASPGSFLVRTFSGSATSPTWATGSLLVDQNFDGTWTKVLAYFKVPSTAPTANITINSVGAATYPVQFNGLTLTRVSGSTLIQDGVITTDHISVSGLKADVITSGSFAGEFFTGGTFTGAEFRTSESNPRVWFNENGLYAHNGTVQTFSLTASTGTINGFTITGATIVGGTVATALSGPRVQMTGSILQAVNSSGQETFRLSGDSGSFSGFDISGSTITGTTVTGGVIRTSSGTSRVQLDTGNSGQLYVMSGGYTRLRLSVAEGLEIFSPTGVLQGSVYGEATQMRLEGPSRLLLTGLTVSMGFHGNASSVVEMWGRGRVSILGPANAEISMTSGGIYQTSTWQEFNISTATAAHSTWVIRPVSLQSATRAVMQFVGTMATTTLAANLHMDSNGLIFKSTSTRAAKVAIQDVATDPFRVLDVAVRDWYDRGEVEGYAAQLAGEADYVPPGPLRRIPGVIAEELEELGLEQFVTYDKDGEPNNVLYDRLPLLLIPVVRDLRARLERLENHA